MQQQLQQLFHRGYVTFSFLSAEEVEEYRDRLMVYLQQEAPEFQDNLPENHWFSLTGFGALGVPSSFHNEIVRELRLKSYNKLLDFLKRYSEIVGGDYVDVYIDRLMIRQGRFPGKRAQSASAEGWHRDESVDEFGNPMPDSDTIFGGWINLNEFSEFLLAAPGTHFTDRNRGTGFGVVKEQKERKALDQILQKIEVPAGHILLFYENLAHKVVASAPPPNTTQMRLFTGFRLTDSTVPFYSDLEQKIRSMDVIPLKSGQIPPMYAKLSWTNHTEAMQNWTLETLIPMLTEKRKMGPSAKMAGREFIIPKGGAVSDPMPALRYSFEPYQPQDWIQYKYPGILESTFDFAFPQYEDEELQLYKPRPLTEGPIILDSISSNISCSSCFKNTRLGCENCGASLCSSHCSKLHICRT